MIDPFYVERYKRITKSVLNSCCYICGSDISIEMHHVKHVRKSNYTYQGFHRIMHLLNRKQIPVCKECHKKIHNGSYDALSLKKLV